ncbi:MAG: response regulator [Magnetococcales bacterium]|nr:response regulator [Magnetococcales bacterium]
MKTFSDIPDRLLHQLGGGLETLLVRSRRGFARQVGIAVALVVLAFVVRELIGPPELGLPFLTFFPGAALAAFFGGFWSGMMAAVMGAILATYSYIPPYRMLLFDIHSATVFGNLVYLLDELIVCSAMATLHRYHLRAREQYAELHTLLQTIPEMIWLKDPAGVYLKCNIAFERLLGRTQEQIIGHIDRELFGAEVAEVLREKDRAAMATATPQIDEAWVPSAAQEQPILRETIKTALRTADGRVLGVLGIGRDITERRQMENAVARHQQELESLVAERTQQVLLLNAGLEEQAAKAIAASAAKSAFLANMSHEIRTPMNAILGLSHLLTTTPLNGEQRAFVTKIQGAGRSLLGIINDVLDFSRIEAGRMELHHADFNLGQLLDDLATLMAGNAGNKKLELIIGREPDLPEMLRGDGQHLTQVLTNLVGNAIKFTENGHVALQVRRLEQRSRHVRLHFSVKDTGIGIAPEAVACLFTPFTQADGSITRRFGGAGLGLAISKRLVELMGGELGVNSTPGVGSEFWVSAPFEVIVEHDNASVSPVVRVLIADDHDLQRAVLATTVQSLGWHPEVVVSGREVLDRLRVLHDYDILLLDWKMPELDGLATSKALMNDPDCPEAPIILMVTAHSQDELRQAPEAALLDGILTKPVTASSLLNAVTYARAKREGHCDGLVAVGQPGQGQRRLGGVRVLVVDDSDINLDVARRLLELEGAVVATATQGLEALDLLRHDPEAYEVVLMDVQMPVMDGNRAVQAIREDLHLRELPVIALTAGALDSERQRALDAGMNDFIAKPFDVEKMIRCVRHWAGPRGETTPAGGGEVLPGCVSVDPWPELPGIDGQEARARLGGDRTLFLSILDRLCDEFQEVARDVAAELARGEIPEAAMRLHKLRGVAGNAGASALHALAGELETTLRVTPERGIADHRLAELDVAMATLVQACAPHLEQPTNPTLSDAGEAAAGVVAEPATLEALLVALDEQSCDALPLFAALKPGLCSRMDAAKVEEIAQAITQLRFAEARTRLSGSGSP